jgi:hypothetical protein
MATCLKGLAATVALLGLLAGAGFLHRALSDAEYRRAALAKERNPGNVLFESEFRIAEARRVFLIYSAAACFLVAVLGGGILWAVGELHRKVDRLASMRRLEGDSNPS